MKLFSKLLLKTLLTLFFTINCTAQNQIAITIDDVPNTAQFAEDHFKSTLLNKLDSLAVPIAIFINYNKINKTKFRHQNLKLLKDWVNKNYVTCGNHTFSHSRYSEVGWSIFTKDIKKGSRYEKLKKHDRNSKTLNHFRFPYNDLGKDSLEHIQVKNFLTRNNYQITPFTIESLDWMYNAVYNYYLKKNDIQQANKIGTDYVNKTMELLAFFEVLAQQKYNRTIKHIYLCHDNSLNTKYLPLLINELKRKKYDFISLDQALEDDIYKQDDVYYKKWGISWLYRWMKNAKERNKTLMSEPSTKEIEKLHNTLILENDTL